MLLRFCSGSVTPFKSRQKSFRCVHADHVQSQPLAQQFQRVAEIRSCRSSPLSTNTFVSRSPMARCTSAAATAESTPPLSAQIARAPSACLRMASTVSAMKPARLQFCFGAADLEHKIAQNFGAALGVMHLGMKLHGVEPLRGILDRRHGIVRAPGHVKSRGKSDT